MKASPSNVLSYTVYLSGPADTAQNTSNHKILDVYMMFALCKLQNIAYKIN